MTRLACFYIPMFVLAARLRSEPDLLNEAVGIVEGNGSNAHIVAATRRARLRAPPRARRVARMRRHLPPRPRRHRGEQAGGARRGGVAEVAGRRCARRGGDVPRAAAADASLARARSRGDAATLRPRID